MIIITIDNAQSRILCKDMLLFNRLSDLLSYDVPGKAFAMRHCKWKGWDGKVRLLKNTGNFPTGLLPNILKYLRTNGISYDLQYNMQRPKKSIDIVNNSEWAPRDYQQTALDRSDKYSRGVVVMGVGGGKTYTASLIVQDKGVPTLFVTPDTGLREQAYEDFCEYFVDGDKYVSKDFYSDKPIIIHNIQSLVNKPSDAFKRFQMLMIDEFHHSASDSYIKLNMVASKAYYRYGLTGSYLRADGHDMKMLGVLSHVVYKKTASELIKEGWLVPPYITFMPFNAAMEGVSYAKAYNQTLYGLPFNKIVAKITRQKIKENKQTLVLVGRKRQGRIINELTDNTYFLSGDDDLEYREYMKAKFIKKEIPCLIATSIFGEGQNIKSIDVLINARLQESEIQTTQGIGRALRKSEGKKHAEVFDFLIHGNKHLLKHSKSRLETYRKESEFKIFIKKNI